ncbi:MAG: MotE family protein [Brevundimonas sp.]|uniref:MotE family protein n=1 Tax=Brevundimonas sp. TaxID=1871086 RepID=UPI00391A4211
MSRLPRILPLIAVAIGGVVVLRAAGAAPELFQGARAWAEEAVQPAGEGAAAAPAKPAPAVCALSPEQLAQQAGLSPAELRVLQSLSKRREDLDARDADFATMLPLMASAEQKLDAKLQAMEALKAEMQGLLGQVDEREKAEIDRLVQVYSAMRPREAAAVFNTLNDSVRLPVAAAMRPRSLAAVMAQMPPAAARELTEKLARRYEAQQLAARTATASAPLTAAEPGSVATGAPAAAPAPTPAAAPPVARPAAQPAAQPAARARPPAQRAANRTTESRPPAAAPAPEPAGPQPYRAAPAAEAPAAAPGRQQVQ